MSEIKHNDSYYKKLYDDLNEEAINLNIIYYDTKFPFKYSYNTRKISPFKLFYGVQLNKFVDYNLDENKMEDKIILNRIYLIFTYRNALLCDPCSKSWLVGFIFLVFSE